MEHILYKDGDIGIPECITDNNGQVAIGMCKICGGAECELKSGICPGRRMTYEEGQIICNGEYKNEQNLPFKAKEIYVDIDGVLTNETEGFGSAIYAERTPKQWLINHINNLHEKGHNITLWTARHLEDEKDTLSWLRKHNVKFHKLILGKPHYDLFIDDHCVHPENLKELLKKEIV